MATARDGVWYYESRQASRSMLFPLTPPLQGMWEVALYISCELFYSDRRVYTLYFRASICSTSTETVTIMLRQYFICFLSGTWHGVTCSNARAGFVVPGGSFGENSRACRNAQHFHFFYLWSPITLRQLLVWILHITATQEWWLNISWYRITLAKRSPGRRQPGILLRFDIVGRALS